MAYGLEVSVNAMSKERIGLGQDPGPLAHGKSRDAGNPWNPVDQMGIAKRVTKASRSI
jgi:hypothetical protein